MKALNRYFLAPLLALAAVVALASTSGCAGTRNAYKAADSVDEYAYVLTEHYSALVKQAADLAAIPTTPQAVREALKRADAAAHLVVVGDARAVPRVAGLAELAANYKQIRTAENQLALQKAVDAAVIKVADLVRVLRSGGVR